MKVKSIAFLTLVLSTTLCAAPRFQSPWSTELSWEHRRVSRCPLPGALDEDSLHIYDAVKFISNLSFSFSPHNISGTLEIELTPRGSVLGQVDLRLTESLAIDSVYASGNHTATFARAGADSLQVFLNPPVSPGDTVTVGIAYQGDPATIDSWGGFRWADANGWRPEIGFSMGDGLNLETPPANYNWIPTYADPSDKALWEAWFRIPTGKAATTNGVRLDTVNNGDNTTTWHYRLDQPVSTYLFFVSVSTYVIQTQRESDPLIENFVYPSRVAEAPVHFSNVPAVLDSFTAWFGPYPFDRMGYNMTRLGDMEHATCVSHVDWAVAANHTYDWLLFHEMSHMWWGDWVTCGDWRDLWLNEGFGTFCEAMSMEALGGREAYQDYMETSIFPDALGANDSYSIYDPDYYWGATVYEKGASVMHMLRCLLGDSAFFDALSEYGQEHAFSDAVTTEWQAKLEEHYGGSLDWFFQPWVYGTRYPRYEVHYGFHPSYPILISQVQPTSTLFRMPVDIRAFSGVDSATVSVWLPAVRDTSFWWSGIFPQFPSLDSVLLDPDNKILKTVQYYEDAIRADEPQPKLPSEFSISSVFPNPFNSSTSISFELPGTSPVQLTIFDLSGREAQHVNVSSMPAGLHVIAFDGSRLASGVYLVRLESHFGTRLAKAILLK